MPKKTGEQLKKEFDKRFGPMVDEMKAWAQENVSVENMNVDAMSMVFSAAFHVGNEVYRRAWATVITSAGSPFVREAGAALCLDGPVELPFGVVEAYREGRAKGLVDPHDGDPGRIFSVDAELEEGIDDKDDAGDGDERCSLN